MAEIKLCVPPVGAKVFRRAPKWKGEVPVYRGISYCHAISSVTSGGEVWVDGSSIETCQWAPFVLGFAQPSADSVFEKSLEPCFEPGTNGVYLAGLSDFRRGLSPDVVIVRSRPETLKAMLDLAGEDRIAWEHIDEGGRMAKSALPLLYGKRKDWRALLAGGTNVALSALDRLPGWRRLTTVLFKSRIVTAAFDQIIKRSMADMSMCRNSTVIPLLSGKANASYFCTGGIAWGGNDPGHMTSGWPWKVWREIEGRLNH